MEPTPQELEAIEAAICVEELKTAFVPHWHAVVEGPLVENDDDTRERIHANVRAFVATRDEAEVKAMEGIAATCEDMEIDFDPSEWTLLDLHMHGGN